MEVLFRFLNWVSSFHTVDEESGNKMDTWNIATVMAPNILRESNDKEMRNVDQGAVKVVFDLIENNDEFSEVRLHIISYMAHADLSRFHPRSWNFSTMTTRQTCPPRKSCVNGNSEERTLSQHQLQQHHQEIRALLHRRRINAMHLKSHQLTATRNPMRARHQYVTLGQAGMRWPPLMLITHRHSNTTWVLQTLNMDVTHRTLQRAIEQHHRTGTATDPLRTKSRHRSEPPVQVDETILQIWRIGR